MWPLTAAHTCLREALGQVSSELERDGAIQRFKFTYELTWKTLKKILAFRGIEANSPREVFRYAAKENFLDDVEILFDFIKKRNLTTHVYNKRYTQEIFNSLPLFEQKVSQLILVLKGLTL